MSEFAEKKALKAQIAAAKKAGKSMQTVGKLQYKLNQLMKTKQKGKPVKPLTGSPSAGTGTAKKVAKKVVKKKAGGKMSDLVYDKPKGKGTGIVKSTAKTTPYKAAKIKKVTPKKVGYTPTNPKVLENLSAAAKKQAKNERLQAARRKLSTAKKVKERQKDYRNNRNTSY